MIKIINMRKKLLRLIKKFNDGSAVPIKTSITKSTIEKIWNICIRKGHYVLNGNLVILLNRCDF